MVDEFYAPVQMIIKIYLAYQLSDQNAQCSFCEKKCFIRIAKGISYHGKKLSLIATFLT